MASFLAGCNSTTIYGDDAGDYTIFTPDIATDINQQLYSNSNYVNQSLTLYTVITTDAGTFYIDASDVAPLKVALDRVDTNDDGEISQAEMQAHFDKTIETLGEFPFSEPEKLGVPLKFSKFSPSSTWLENKEILASEIENNNISHFWYDVGRGANNPNLFQMTTTATDAGWTPDLFDYSSQYCNSENNCRLTFFSHTYDFNAGVSTPNSDPFLIGMGLWVDADKASIDITMVHEHGHKIYANIAKRNGKLKLLPVVLDWMSQQDQTYQEVSQRLSSKSWIGKRKHALQYTTEESCDVAHLEIYYGSPQPEALLKDHTDELGDTFFLPKEEFLQQYTGIMTPRTPEVNAMHLALRYFSCQHAGLDEVQMQQVETNVAYYKDQMKFHENTRQLFDDMLVLYQAANEFMKQDEQRTEVQRYWAEMSLSS